jgi:hypothetical protein
MRSTDPVTEATKREAEVTRAQIDLEKARQSLEKEKILAQEVAPTLVIRHPNLNGGRMTRQLLRAILRELRRIRRQDSLVVKSPSLHRPHRLRRPFSIVTVQIAAEELGLTKEDLVELGDEARKVLDREKRDIRPHEGRTYRVREDREDR